MVILLALALLIPVTALAGPPIDEDRLRLLLAPSESEHARRSNRSKVSGGSTVPVPQRAPVVIRVLKTPADAPAPAIAPVSGRETPQVTKYRAQEPAVDTPSTVSASTAKPPRKRPAALVDPDIYIPPPRIDTESTTHSQVYAAQSRGYGIVIGTWFKAHIDRRVTNADNGQVEVVLDEAVVGKYKTLPAGATLFGQKSFNQASQRLDLSLSNGITPAGVEFDFSATVYDSSKVSGLSGSVVRQRGEEVQSAASRGALASARTIMSATVDTAAAGAIADGVGQAGDELLNNERQLIRQPRVLIQVSPQPVLVRVNQTF